MDRAVWRELLKLVFRPFRKAWNLIGVGVPGAITAWAWVTHNPVWALLVGLVTTCSLLGWAGYRLQRDKLSKAPNAILVEQLGYRMILGQHTFFEIEQAHDEFLERQASVTKEEYVLLLDKASRPVREWRDGVRKVISSHLGMSQVALFESNAGLTAQTPPPKLTTGYFADQWRELDLRLQRAHQLLERLTNEVQH